MTSGLITVILSLWIFNFIAGLIQRTYATGKAFGGFYRNYLHSNLKRLLHFFSLIFPWRQSSLSKNTNNSLTVIR